MPREFAGKSFFSAVDGKLANLEKQMGERTAASLPAHTLGIAEVLAAFATDPVSGLSDAEAAKRLKQYGANELHALRRISPLAVFFRQFQNVLVVILLIATVLSGLLGHGVEAGAIAVIVLLAVLLGFVQEFRAERALEALRTMTAPGATVFREGDQKEIPARDLVPGDIIFLRVGDKVPADARLIEAVNLQIEESPLTGESVPVEKHTTALANEQLAVGDRRNMAYTGTTVTYGRGRGVVVASGMQTEIGAIAQLLETVEAAPTPLQQNLNRLGQILARAALAIVVVIVAMGLARGQPLVDMLIFGIALAVAVVPEALPAVVTIALALGVQRMVKRNALVRHLPAVETLGGTSVICSDKTGTLTKDEMTVRKIFVGGQLLDVSGAGYDARGFFSHAGAPVEPTDSLQLLLRAAVLASDAQITRHKSDDSWQVKGDPTEGALLVAGAKAKLHKKRLEEQFPRIAEIPFTSETKRMTTLHATDGGVVSYTKGAPEVVLESCVRQQTTSGEAVLDACTKEEILTIAQRLASEALRVLGVAYKPGTELENAESGMTFLGLVGMIDPPRPEAKAAIQKCALASIKPVMITGDHPITAQAVARELGVLKNGRVVTGAELEAIDEHELEQKIDNIEVFARVSPAHKLRIVTALQNKGHVVAMTGDGINDAPALRKADIGIAMGITGTDVSKEAASMTLTDDNFASIVAAIEEGRAIFENIKKFLMYLLSANIGEIGLLAGAMALGLPLPLTAVQILYVNLATDGLPALALAVDPSEEDLMRRKPRDPRKGIFTRPSIFLMAISGLWSTGINLGLFGYHISIGRSLGEAMAVTFVTLILIEFLKAYSFRSEVQSVFHRIFANWWLNVAVLGQIGLLFAIVYVPLLQEPFGTFNMRVTDWATIVGAALTLLPVLEFAKRMARQGWFGEFA